MLTSDNPTTFKTICVKLDHCPIESGLAFQSSQSNLSLSIHPIRNNLNPFPNLTGGILFAAGESLHGGGRRRISYTLNNLLYSR